MSGTPAVPEQPAVIEQPAVLELPAVLKLQGLEVCYDSFEAVRSVDLEVAGSGIVAIVGASGCGKTSLLRAIAGFEVPTAGSVQIHGRPVCGPGVWVPPEERQVGMVFQEGALFPHLSVEQNVAYGLQRQGSAKARTRQMLELVGLGDCGSRYPDELSGGQRQRVALARALAPAPQLVLLDEPFASLDELLRERLRVEVRRILAEVGATGVLVTHDQQEALSIADRVVVMARGEVLQEGPPQEIYHAPASLEVAEFFGGGQLIDCRWDGDRLQTIFGCAASGSESSGVETEVEAVDKESSSGQIYARPEDFHLLAGDTTEVGVSGRIVERRFLGHDALDTVALSTGAAIEARVLAPDVRPIGTEVRVRLRDRAYRVFPESTTR